MEIAVVTDSSSGIRREEAEELGIYLVPIPFMIGGTEYREGFDLTEVYFYQQLQENAEITTSQPAPGDVLELWDSLLKQYDQIVHIPMTSGLSNACSTAKILAEEYKGKVFVVDNHRISATQRQSVIDALLFIRQGMDGAQVKEKLEAHGLEASIYIAVDTLEYLKRGGRITPAVAALGTALKIKPVLQIQGGKLDVYGKARGMKAMKKKLMGAVEQDRNERFAGKDIWIQAAYSGPKEVGEAWRAEIEEAFPEYAPIHIDPLSFGIVCHTGPGALGIGCILKES